MMANDVPVSQATPLRVEAADDPQLTFEQYVAMQATWLAEKLIKMIGTQTVAGVEHNVDLSGATTALSVFWGEPSGARWELKLTRSPELDDEDDEFLAGLDDGEGDD